MQHIETQEIATRTVHTIRVDVENKVLAAIKPNDLVDIVLQGPADHTLPRRMTQREVNALLATSDDPDQRSTW